MRISIVIPEHLTGRSFLQPPLEMALCMAYFKLDGHTVKLIDNRVEHMPLDLIAEKIKDAELIIIPTTLYDCMQNYWIDFRLHLALTTVNHIKRTLTDIPTVVCGSHGTIRPDLILRDTLADIVVLGEYELTLRQLAGAIGEHRNIEEIPNIAFKNGIRFTRTKYDSSLFYPPMENDVLPDYSQIDFEKYYHEDFVDNQLVKKPRWGTVLAHKGCPYSCLFCFNFFGKSVRGRTAKSVVDEIERMEKLLSLKGVYFIDSTFGLHKSWVLELCKLIRDRNLSIPWNVESRCDLLPLDVLKEMKSANCERIWVGIESFDEGVLRGVRKGISVQTIEDFLVNARRAELEVGVFINLGLPGETIDSLNRTISNLHFWKLAYTKSIIIASPKFGTEYYGIAKEQYPYIGDNWNDLHAIAGLVGNEMTPSILRNAVWLLYQRNFIYTPNCPRITERGLEYE